MSEKNKQETIQQKMTRLSEIVSWFDGEDFQLEAAFTKFSEAEKLAKGIESDLHSMKNEIDVLKKRFDGDN